MIRKITQTSIVCISIVAILAQISLSEAQQNKNLQDQGFDTGNRQGQSNTQNDYTQNLTPRQRYCFALEKRLAQAWVTKANARKNLPQIDEEIEKWRKTLVTTKRKAERGKCYRDLFIFGKELRKTRKCQRLGKKINEAKFRLRQLQDTRRNVTTNDTTVEDNLISQLANAGCGSQYEKEDRRRNRLFSIFGDDDDDDRKNKGEKRILPFATYRTMCVRTCDGFYYPVSFSTLQSRFPIDEAACQSRCAAPAQLFVYQNPGETVEQMVSLNGEAYTSMPYAFRYRKEFVKGCSCKTGEFSPEKLGLDTNTDANNNQSKLKPGSIQKSEIKRKNKKQPK